MLTENTETVEEYRIDFTRLLYMQYREIDNAIRHADTKAQLILGINAILVAALTSNIAQENVLVIFEILVVLLLLLSLVFALMTVMPRFSPGKQEPNIFFFGDLVDMPYEEYIATYLGLTLHEVKMRIMRQMHIKSRIVNRKYKSVRLSVYFLLMALITWAVGWFLPTLITS